MSARYSNSPALRLAVADSRLQRLAHALLGVLCAASLWRVQGRGYPVLALLLLPVSAHCWWELRRQALAGSLLHWRAGVWQLERGGRRAPVAIQSTSRCVGRLIYLAWGEGGGRRCACLLFPDCAATEDLRQLRARIVLLGRV